RQFTTQYDWDYASEPEPQLLGRHMFLPRGKMVGGTSRMNGMIYIRGVPSDYDGWLEDGCTGWGWSDVLPYFIRAEANARGADELHGHAGPLTVSDRISRHPVVEAWVEAGVRAGWPLNPDFNGESQEGVGYYQLTLRGARRCSTDVAYLRSALHRPNLRLI